MGPLKQAWSPRSGDSGVRGLEFGEAGWLVGWLKFGCWRSLDVGMFGFVDSTLDRDGSADHSSSSSSPCIIHHLSSIIYELSSIIDHPTSINYHVSPIIYHLSSITYQVSSITHHLSYIRSRSTGAKICQGLRRRLPHGYVVSLRQRAGDLGWGSAEVS